MKNSKEEEKKKEEYQIVDKDDQILAILQSSTIDLDFVTGSEVVVTGKVVETRNNLRVVNVTGVQL